MNPNAILVSRRQEGNPLLRHIRNVRWQFDDIVPDYVLGANHCALFLSLRWPPGHPVMLAPGHGCRAAEASQALLVSLHMVRGPVNAGRDACS